MNANATMALARSLKISLSVDRETLEIVAKPKDRITPGLRAAIRENRDELVRDLILKAALAWLGARHVEGANLSGTNALEEELNRLYVEGTVGEFRETVRAWAAEMALSCRRSAETRSGNTGSAKARKDEHLAIDFDKNAALTPGEA